MVVLEQQGAVCPDALEKTPTRACGYGEVGSDVTGASAQEGAGGGHVAAVLLSVSVVALV